MSDNTSTTTTHINKEKEEEEEQLGTRGSEMKEVEENEKNQEMMNDEEEEEEYEESEMEEEEEEEEELPSFHKGLKFRNYRPRDPDLEMYMLEKPVIPNLSKEISDKLTKLEKANDDDVINIILIYHFIIYFLFLIGYYIVCTS